MAAQLLKKTKASSLIETLVALTILLIIFSIAVLFFVQTDLSRSSAKKVRAEELAGLMLKNDNEILIADSVQEVDDLIVKKRLDSYGTNGLQTASIQVYDLNDKLIYSMQKILLPGK